jgi:CheY-like chemotaxis protein
MEEKLTQVPTRVLLVDDNPSDRALTRRTLAQEFAPLEVEEVFGPEGLEAALARGGFDVAVTDYQLGWSDGLTVLAAVKARLPGCPVVMFTNSGNEEVAVAALRSGLDDYVVKSAPNYVRLGTAVRGALQRAESRRAAARYQEELRASEVRYRALAEENARLLTEATELTAKQRAFLKDVLLAVTDGRLHLCDSAADLPDPLPDSGGGRVPLSPSTLREVRRRVREAGAAAGLPVEAAQDLMTAASEAAMNAAVHGGGGGARVGADTAAGVVQVTVADRGPGIGVDQLHRAVLERGFTTGGSGFGHGYFLILRSADRVYLLTGPGGTTVVLEQGRERAEPTWL